MSVRKEIFIPIKVVSGNRNDLKRIFIVDVKRWIKENNRTKKINKGRSALFISFVFKSETKIDIDNLLKSTLDAVKGTLFQDDIQVKKILASVEENPLIQQEGVFIKMAKIIN